MFKHGNRGNVKPRREITYRVHESWDKIVRDAGVSWRDILIAGLNFYRIQANKNRRTTRSLTRIDPARINTGKFQTEADTAMPSIRLSNEEGEAEAFERALQDIRSKRTSQPAPAQQHPTQPNTQINGENDWKK